MLTTALPDVWRWVQRRRGTQRLGGESAGDLVQSVCREALEARGKFEDRGDRQFQAYMRVLTERKLADRVRHWSAARREAARREPLGEFDPQGTCEGPVTLAAQRDLAEHVVELLANLPPDQAAVLRLQVESDLSTGEIAHSLGKSEGAVRILRCRGLSTLGGFMDTGSGNGA